LRSRSLHPGEPSSGLAPAVPASESVSGKGETMKKKAVVTGLVAMFLLVAGFSVYAQVAAVKRPYRNGSVWDVAFIRMKPGMGTAYLNYIATE
jgi:hypothetical protein